MRLAAKMTVFLACCLALVAGIVSGCKHEKLVMSRDIVIPGGEDIVVKDSDTPEWSVAEARILPELRDIQRMATDKAATNVNKVTGLEPGDKINVRYRGWHFTWLILCANGTNVYIARYEAAPAK